MNAEIKKYNKHIEIQAQKSEYEKARGFSGEKRLLHRPEETEEFKDLEENPVFHCE